MLKFAERKFILIIIKVTIFYTVFSMVIIPQMNGLNLRIFVENCNHNKVHENENGQPLNGWIVSGHWLPFFSRRVIAPFWNWYVEMLTAAFNLHRVYLHRIRKIIAHALNMLVPNWCRDAIGGAQHTVAKCQWRCHFNVVVLHVGKHAPISILTTHLFSFFSWGFVGRTLLVCVFAP